MSIRSLAVLLSLGFFLIVSELALRVFKVSAKNENLYFLLNPELNYPEFFLRDKKLFWKFRPNQIIKSRFMVEGEYRINSLGLRNTEISPPKPAGTYRIICLGNSNTFGWGQSEGNAYPQKLQKLFQTKSPPENIEVINAGLTGYSSQQGKIFLPEQILPLEPDLITINYGWNDLLPAKFGIADKEQKMPPQWILDVQNLLSRTNLYQLLKSFWVGRFSKKEVVQKGVSRVSLEDFQQNLVEMAKICQKHDIKVVFLTNPVASLEAFWGAGKSSRVHQINQVYNHAIRELTQNHRYYVLDIAKLFTLRGDLYADGKKDYIHYNAAGHKLVAETIYNYLIEQDFIPVESYSLEAHN